MFAWYVKDVERHYLSKMEKNASTLIEWQAFLFSLELDFS